MVILFLRFGFNLWCQFLVGIPMVFLFHGFRFIFPMKNRLCDVDSSFAAQFQLLIQIFSWNFYGFSFSYVLDDFDDEKLITGWQFPFCGSI